MRIGFRLVLLSLLLVASCSDVPEPLEQTPTPQHARVRVIDGGGFDDSGNSGATGTQWAPIDWRFVAGFGFARDSEDVDGCVVSGLCNLGDLRQSWGTLGPSPFPDGNPAPDGGPSPSFGVMSTSNFHSGGYVINLESAIETFTINLPQEAGVFYDFRIDAAFGTGQINNGPGQNDFAVVELHAQNQVTEILRWTRDDLQPGGQGVPSANSIDCGTAFLGTSQAFPLCTGWERHYVDVSAFAGQGVIVRIRVRQALPDNDIATFLAMDNASFEGYDAVPADIDILPNDPANVIDLNVPGAVPVALFGSAALDVTTIDPATFRIGQVYISRSAAGLPQATFGDFNNDGLLDVLLQFDHGQLITNGALTAQTTSFELVGILPDRTRVVGSQPISISGRAAMDVKPDKISLSLTGTVTVYLYSSATFNAASTNPASIRWFNDGAGVGASVAQRNGVFMSSVRDFNGDGRADRLLTFLRTDLVAAGLSTATTSFVVADRAGSLKFEATDAVQPSILP